jgi:hypothetical protein
MKKILSLILMFVCVVAIQAQLPVASKIKTMTAVQQGYTANFNSSYTDTLKSGDTLFYVCAVTHYNEVNPYLQVNFNKIAADTTAVVTLWQSMTGVTTSSTSWNQVKSGSSPSAWSATISANTEYDGHSLPIWFAGRYIGIRFIGKTKTGFKTRPYGTVKFNID